MHSKYISGIMNAQVDDCIGKFLYMRSATAKVKQLKDEGKPMPKDYQQLEQQLGKSCCSFMAQMHSTLMVSQDLWSLRFNSKTVIRFALKCILEQC